MKTKTKKDDEKVVKVSFPAWGVSPKSWYLLTERAPSKNGWSGGTWIPKKCCTLTESKHEIGVGILTLPLWLYEAKTKENVSFTDLEDNIIQ